MADTDILSDNLETLLKEDNFQKAYDLVRKWERDDCNTCGMISDKLLLLISKTYLLNWIDKRLQLKKKGIKSLWIIEFNILKISIQKLKLICAINL